MQEELGDLLLQVFFHARVAEDDKNQPFNIEDIAKGIADKLERRHPHVFGGASVKDSAEVLENWEKQKAEEKGRTSAIDGVPLAQPALPLIAKLLYRADKFDYELAIEKELQIDKSTDTDSFGKLMLGLISQAVELGIDPEVSLRNAAKGLIKDIQAHEQGRITS
jgi:XTP/dITP diphosphohydrolase